MTLDVGDGLAVGLDVLDVVIDLDVEGRFVYLDLVIIVGLILQPLQQRRLVQHNLTRNLSGLLLRHL